MVDPVTWTVIAVGAVVASTALSMASAQQQASAVAKSAKLNARLAQQEQETQAQLAMREASIAEHQALQEGALRDIERDSERRQADRLLAEQRALIGGLGIEFGGSPLLVAVETAEELELEIAMRDFESQQRQQTLRDQGLLRTFEASEFRRAGRNALGVGAFQARQARTAGHWQMASAFTTGLRQGTGIFLTPSNVTARG
jgi:hypothetical protein